MNCFELNAVFFRIIIFSLIVGDLSDKKLKTTFERLIFFILCYIYCLPSVCRSFCSVILTNVIKENTKLVPETAFSFSEDFIKHNGELHNIALLYSTSIKCIPVMIFFVSFSNETRAHIRTLEAKGYK